MKHYLNSFEVREITGSYHRDPHHILGRHKDKNGYHINVYQPYATSIQIISLVDEHVYPMELVEDGFFTVQVPDAFKYKVRFENSEGDMWEMHDPYSFAPVITEFDRHLFANGTHYEVYNKMGAHHMEVDGIEGVLFAVWAPNAKRVSVVGDFCGWDGRIFPMRALAHSGIFELFIPGLTLGTIYKYEIKTHDEYILKKSDPYGNYAEVRPNTASVVTELNGYGWKDMQWIAERDETDQMNRPMSVYEVHLGSWKRNDTENGFLSYKELAHELVDYVKEMGYTHIELMPIAEHPFDGSWGYQVMGYFAPTSRFGEPKDFMYFIDHCHQNGIGVILDWVPAHFPKDAHGLIKFDGTALYEHADPKQGEHPHWGTMIFNLDRNEVTNFLISNAIYWLDKFHIDGLRVDAVASMLYLDYGKEAGEWVPNQYGGRENLVAVEFFKHLNSILNKRYPGVLMIAEESTAWAGVSKPAEQGGLGFNLKWNMGWMNDFLRYISKEPIHRQYHHGDLTFSMIYAYTENFVLVLSHDEVVHGKGSMINKMPGDYWQKFANLRAAYGFMYSHPGKKLLFMGGEIAQFDEWSEARSIQWDLLGYEKHQQMQTYVRELNHLYKNERAFWFDDFTPAGFEWINCADAQSSIVAFTRKTDNAQDAVVVVANFTPVPRTMHRIGVPFAGSYEEIFNSDHLRYGGSGMINIGIKETIGQEWDGRSQCIDLVVPPLGITVFKYRG